MDCNGFSLTEKYVPGCPRYKTGKNFHFFSILITLQQLFKIPPVLSKKRITLIENIDFLFLYFIQYKRGHLPHFYIKIANFL